jgi:prevent-host-death family protein
MGPVSIKEARRRLADLIRAAEHGETTVITRRGKTVARIAPADKGPAKRFPDMTEFRKSIKVRGKPMSQVVADMRREARY